MTRQLPIMTAFGLASAVLYASALSGLSIGLLITYLAQLPLFAAGLWMGVQAAAVAGAVGIVAITFFGGVMPGILFAVSTAVPVAILVMLALRKRTWTDGLDYWYPPGNLLRAAAIWCSALLIVAAIALAAFADGISAVITAFVGRIGDVVAQVTGQEAAPGALEPLAGVLPGVTAWTWMIMTTINGLLAQQIVRRAGKNIRPTPAVSEILVPLSWAAAFGIAVAASYVLTGDLQFVTANLAIILAYPLLFQGLSVVHAALASFGAWTAGYVAFYAVLIIFGWLAFVLVAVGMAEPLLKLRERLPRPKNT